MVVLLAIGAMMYWQFSNPPYLRKGSISNEITQLLGNELKNINNIEVLSKSAIFTNTKLNGEPIVHIQATILSKDTSLSGENLKKAVKQYLEDNLHFRDQSIHKVYQITVLED